MIELILITIGQIVIFIGILIIMKDIQNIKNSLNHGKVKA